MNINPSNVIYSAIGGSHAYGTNTETSDVDLRGIFIPDLESHFQMDNVCDQINDAKKDVVHYSLKRFFELIKTANPNIVEMLWFPEDCIKVSTKEMAILIENRHLFITKKAFFSHAAYAQQQCKKARGKNKKVMNEPKYFDKEAISELRDLLLQDKISQEWVEVRFSSDFFLFLSKDLNISPTQNTDFKAMDQYLKSESLSKILPPRRKDFCYFVPQDRSSDIHSFPMRPIPLVNAGIDLKKYNCSSLEHVGHVYRLYYYGDEAKGVFSGKEVVCSSIPEEHEETHFQGILIVSNNEYESAKSEWRSFWEWMSKRNEHRWKSDDNNENFKYDAKNMQHTMRLLLSSENIARNGEPIVRFYGDDLAFLRKVRTGAFDYDYLISMAEDKLEKVKDLFDKSSLPDSCNLKKANEVCVQMYMEKYGSNVHVK